MASHSVVGRILDSREKAHVKWEISCFYAFSHKPDTFYESPPFYFLGTTWCVIIFPNGDSQSAGWISLYLAMQDVCVCSVTYSLSIESNQMPVKRVPITTCTFDENNKGHGSTRIVPRSELKINNVFRNATVYCKVTASTLSEVACQTLSQFSYNLFCRDFQDLLVSGIKSDVTIEVLGSEFKAHRWILEASSPVFAALLASDMSETNDDVMVISGCDPDTFHNLLGCIYSGKVKNISPDNMMSLFKAADKFCVDGLKQKCVKIMAEELSVDIVCEVLVLADKYNETQLWKCAKEFLLENIKTVLITDKWSSFKTENAAMVSEILSEYVLSSITHEHSCNHGN